MMYFLSFLLISAKRIYCMHHDDKFLGNSYSEIMATVLIFILQDSIYGEKNYNLDMVIFPNVL